MDHKDFARLARATYGDFAWRTAVAKLARVNRSTVYRWSVGEAPVPDEAAEALQEEAARKAARIQALVAE